MVGHNSNSVRVEMKRSVGHTDNCCRRRGGWRQHWHTGCNRRGACRRRCDCCRYWCRGVEERRKGTAVCNCSHTDLEGRRRGGSR